MKKSLTVRVLSDDTEEVYYQLFASNGWFVTSMDFFVHKKDWKDFGNALIQFPSSAADEAKFELSEPGDEGSFYILLRAFCTDLSGHSALEVFVILNDAPPYGYQHRFFIGAEPASLNRLGELLLAWDAEVGSEVVWEPG